MIWAVVPAAGRGLRACRGMPKQYAMLAGKPMLCWTLERLLASSHVEGAVVVLSPDDGDWPGWTRIAGKPVRTATGGSDRAASVRAGLVALVDEVAPDAWVLVHDAARPCIQPDDIGSLVEQGRMHDVGALLALPVADTLKRADEHGQSVGGLPREHAWRAQTPQMFRHGELSEALDRARRDGDVVTDEASALERLGRHPLLVRGSARNIKVTEPDDFALAEWLLMRD